MDGHPTTDAAKALEGCVLPFGGAKGSGIAMMIDVFSGVLSGAAYGSHIHNPFAHPEVPMDTGHCMIAIDISRFQDPEEFKTARTWRPVLSCPWRCTASWRACARSCIFPLTF